MPAIDRSTFEAMLHNPNIPDRELRPYLKLDPVESQAFRPTVKINPATVLLSDTESAAALSSLNGVARWRRQVQYRNKITGWTGLKVVAEGDSWFQYPFLIDDVVDHLFEDWAIFCVSGAGDLLSDMRHQDELTAAIVAEQPDIVLLSGGGNDLLGDGRLARYLARHKPGMQPIDYLTPAFDDLLTRVIAIYQEIIGKAFAAGAQRVVCHTYGRAIPRNGSWLGRPMLKLGIADQSTQRAIVGILIDRFHSGLSIMAKQHSGKLVIVDCRDAVADDEWYDELHPTSIGFAKVADNVRKAVIGAEKQPTHTTVKETAPRRHTALPIGDTTAITALLAEHEDALLAEVGRRTKIIEISPDAANGFLLEVPVRATEFGAAEFRQLGSRIVDRWHRELHKLLCGANGADLPERNKLRDALRLDQAAVIGGITAALVVLAVPAFIAPLIAAVIVKAGLDPAWEVTCQYWKEKLGAP